jgi:hypothetical protein
VTCAVEVESRRGVTPRLVGQSAVQVDDLVRPRIVSIHSSTFLVRRDALLGGLGLVAEDAPGSENGDWDLLLRAAKRADVVHVDEPFVRVRSPRAQATAYEYAMRISSLRWMMARHPEIRGCRPGAARAYGQLACWSAACGNRRDAWYFGTQALRNNWHEPRAAIALAATTRVVPVDRVLGALDRRGNRSRRWDNHRAGP